MTGPVSAEQGTKRRDDRRERTRERMLAAAVLLLRREGLNAVSVSNVAKEVGVHPSLFYAHFKNIDAFLAAAAQRVLETLAPIDRELRRDLMKRAVTDRRELARYFEHAFERWLEQRAFVELLIAHRLDRSSMGQAMRPALAALREDLTAELWGLAAEVGVEGKAIAEVRALADLHLTHWLWALESLIDGRVHDRKLLAAMLADIYIASNMTFFARAQGRTHADRIAAQFSSARRKSLDKHNTALRARIEANDDDALIAAAGSERALVEDAFEGMTKHFLPEAARGKSAVVVWAIRCPRSVVLHKLIVRDGVCDHAPADADADADEKPRIAFTLSLRTWLQTLVRARHFDEAYRTGDIKIEGDVFFAVELLDWFYYS